MQIEKQAQQGAVNAWAGSRWQQSEQFDKSSTCARMPMASGKSQQPFQRTLGGLYVSTHWTAVDIVFGCSQHHFFCVQQHMQAVCQHTGTLVTAPIIGWANRRAARQHLASFEAAFMRYITLDIPGHSHTCSLTSTGSPPRDSSITWPSYERLNPPSSRKASEGAGAGAMCLHHGNRA